MNRLANSTESIIKAFATPIDVHKKQLIYLKLKDLEDLEEDIGMSLLELFRILKCGQVIYKRIYAYKRKIVILETRNIDGLYYDGSYYILKLHNILEDDNDNYDIVYVKDYGITYALTREELENE